MEERMHRQILSSMHLVSYISSLRRRIILHLARWWRFRAPWIKVSGPCNLLEPHLPHSIGPVVVAIDYPGSFASPLHMRPASPYEHTIDTDWATMLAFRRNEFTHLSSPILTTYHLPWITVGEPPFIESSK